MGIKKESIYHMVGKVYYLDHQPTPPAVVGGVEDAPEALRVVVAPPVVALNSRMNQKKTLEKTNS